jgi:hypothetical protein
MCARNDRARYSSETAREPVSNPFRSGHSPRRSSVDRQPRRPSHGFGETDGRMDAPGCASALAMPLTQWRLNARSTAILTSLRRWPAVPSLRASQLRQSSLDRACAICAGATLVLHEVLIAKSAEASCTLLPRCTRRHQLAGRSPICASSISTSIRSTSSKRLPAKSAC